MIPAAIVIALALVLWLIWHYSKPYGGDGQR